MKPVWRSTSIPWLIDAFAICSAMGAPCRHVKKQAKYNCYTPVCSTLRQGESQLISRPMTMPWSMMSLSKERCHYQLEGKGV